MALPIVWRASVPSPSAGGLLRYGGNGTALVVVVLAVLLALAVGFRKAVASSGSPQNILIMCKGADVELR